MLFMFECLPSGRLEVDNFSELPQQIRINRVSFFQPSDSPAELPYLKWIGNADRDSGFMKGFDQRTFVATSGFAHDKGLAGRINLFNDLLDNGLDRIFHLLFDFSRGVTDVEFVF